MRISNGYELDREGWIVERQLLYIIVITAYLLALLYYFVHSIQCNLDL
jgi:hypothetical protein